MNFITEEILELTTSDGGRFKVNSIEEALDFCKRLTSEHYENFPVASVLLPRKFRKYIYPVYAFARIADDIADELTEIDIELRLKSLNSMEKLLHEINSNANISNPIFLALYQTLHESDIPISLFSRLLVAFKNDIKFKQAKEFSDLLDYCSNSANPIGEIILGIFDERSTKNIELSDKICTSLQLINFWQDLSKDISIGRYYIPADLMEKYGINPLNLFDEKKYANFINCLDELFSKTQNLMFEGKKLIERLSSIRLKLEIAFTIEAGLTILQKIKDLNYKILKIRPKLKVIDYSKITLKAIFNYRILF